MTDSAAPLLLDVRAVSKRFPGVLALDQVSLTLGRGEVLALVGENGAGKSTLMKILAGVESPGAGEILVDGRPVRIDGVARALELGIALIHQELNLADNLDVAANIYLGREPHRWGWIDRRSIERGATQALEELGFSLSPRALVGRLSPGQRQMVEIAKALSVSARVLIMDEPTSSLSAGESETLFRVIRELRRRGVSIIYISHRLGEVRELADRAVVLRDGRNAGELAREEIDHDRLVQLMVGRKLTEFYERTPRTPGEPLLAVRNLVVPGRCARPLNFSVRSGEIVGLAGLVGAGRTELLEVLFGVRRPLAGEIVVAGQPVRLASPRDALRAGIALVPEDRKEQGLILELAVEENIGLPGVVRFRNRLGLVDGARLRGEARAMIGRLDIKTPSPGQAVQLLSGGNQQKVVLAKWLALAPRVLLLDEPTRGVDVGAKHEIYRLMEQLAAAGVAVLFASSELEEVLHLADRAIVMHEGRLAGELPHDRLSEEAVMQLATGRPEG